MFKFGYKGINAAGKNVRSEIQATSLLQAKKKLREQNIFVQEIEQLKGKDGNRRAPSKFIPFKKVKVEDMALITRQLSTLLKANLPLVEALTTVQEQTENPYLAEVLTHVRDSVNEGVAFHKALEKYPHIFDKIFISMVEAGEASGALDNLLIRLAEFTEEQHELMSKIKGSMVYPLVMLLMTLVMLGILFVLVVPKIVSVFDSTPELTLEWYTLSVIQISSILVNQWYILLGGSFFAFMLFRTWKSTPSGEKIWDSTVLKMPLVGRLVRLIAISRFSRTLGVLLEGGVPILGALQIVKNVVNNHVLSQAIQKASENIREGESIATPLSMSRQFPIMVIHMIRVGEKTGELEPILVQVSDYYDFQVKNSLASLTSLIEPLMIVFMGCVIGSVVFSIMMPIFQLSNLGG